MRPEHVGRRSRCHQGDQLCLRVDCTTTCVSLNDVNGHRTLLVVEELTQGLVAGLISWVGSLGHEYDLALGGGGCRDGSRSGLGCATVAAGSAVGADAAGAFVGSALAAGAVGAASPPQAARMLPAPRTPAKARRREKPDVVLLNGAVTNHLLKLGAGTP